MTRPRILSQPPARTHAERTMVLSTLSRVSNDPMYEHLAECARTMDTDMLMSAMKEGVFNVPMDIGIGNGDIAPTPPLYMDAHQATGLVFVDSVPQVLKSFASVFSVFEKVRNDIVAEDKSGKDLKQVVKVAELYASDAFSEFYSALVKGFLDDRKSVLSNGAHLHTDSPEKAKSREAMAKRVFRDTAVGLIALACALDKPEEMKSLIDGVPGALQAVGSAEYAGSMNAKSLQGLGNGQTDQQNCRFAAPFFAIHYSSEKCLDVVLEAGWKTREPFARFKCEDPQINASVALEDPLKKWNPHTSSCGLGLIELLDADAAYFSPEMMAKALNAMPDEFGDWRDVDRHALCTITHNIMSNDTELSYGYIPAILTTNLLDEDLAASLETAAEYGAIEVFDKYADRMPWDDLLVSGQRNLLSHALFSSHFDEEQEHFCALIDQIVRIAQADHQPRIFDLHLDRRAGVQPLERIVDLGLAPLLIQFMKNGLRQDTVIEGTNKTLRSILEAADDGSLTHLVHTFEARQRALSALAEIEAEATSSPAP